MPVQAFRDNYIGRFDDVGGNLALKINRLNKAVDIKSEKGHDNKDLALEQMERFRLQPDSISAYKSALSRWKRAVGMRGDCEIFEIKSTSRVFLGTGNASVFEFGFNLNHPWGVPYISGSTLKGAVSSYLARKGGEDWKRIDSSLKSKAQVELFGGMPEGETKSYSGMLVFHDAWLCPWGRRQDKGDWFDKEIITPHYPNYYRENGAPTGMDDPIPIHVAALCPGLRFQVVLQGPKDYRDFAKKVLLELLASEGIGGKTAVGYGRFEYVKTAEEMEEEIRSKVISADSKEKLLACYKAYGKESYLSSLFAEQLLKYGICSETEGAWKTLIPINYLINLVHKGDLSKLRVFNKRFKDLENNIAGWKERTGISELNKSAEGQKLFNLLLDKWPAEVAESRENRAIKALSYGWEDISCSFDDLFENIDSGQINWPPLEDLRSYIESIFSGDERDVLLLFLEEKGF
ncbi:MAG: type III-B CRISPR module RAMP protein Cmr6 [Desulfovibrio sp. S3730MH75]|nr:MAG: type III-B CRISPR module RAMP protein Cmr6 [Desulfovibrio sp. S3730MH75]